MLYYDSHTGCNDAFPSLLKVNEQKNYFNRIVDAIVLHSVIVGIQFLEVLLNPNNPELAFSCGFVQMLLSITVSLLCVIALFGAGAAVNDAYAQHK